MKKVNILSILKSPWAVLSGMTLGVILGIFVPHAVPYIEPIGDIYLSILQMCVIPIMASALVLSMSKLLRSGNGRSFIGRTLLVLIVMLIVMSFASIVISLLVPSIRKPSQDMKKTIGSMVSSEESDEALGFIKINFYAEETEAETQNQMVEFLVDIVPKNIFNALAESDNLKIVFFFLVFGVLLVFLDTSLASPIEKAFEAVYQSFQKLVGLTMYFLPFGLCAMTAAQFSQFGLSVLVSMLLFILLIIGVSILLFSISFAIICLRCRCSPMEQLRAMGETIFIAFGTKNSFAAIPSAMACFTKKFHMDEVKVNAVLPLGISLCRFGNIMIFSLTAVFACGLYEVTMTPMTMLLIVAGSILAGIASSGAPGIVARAMVAMVLSPLLIPAQSLIVVLTMIDPIIDPFATLVNVYPNCAATAMVAN